MQHEEMNPLYRIVVIAIIVIFSLVEIVRLYLGFNGNLTETVGTTGSVRVCHIYCVLCMFVVKIYDHPRQLF